MNDEWTLGMVGPSRRAIMRRGTVRAVCEGAGEAEVMVRKLNSSDSGAAARLAVLRDEVEKALKALAAPYAGAPILEEDLQRARDILAQSLRAYGSRMKEEER